MSAPSLSASMQRLERAGLTAQLIQSLHSAAVKGFAACAPNPGSKAEPSHATMLRATLDATLWADATRYIGNEAATPGASVFVADACVTSIGVAIAAATGLLLGAEAPSPASLLELITAVASFVESVQRPMVNDESVLLQGIVAANAHAALDLHWLLVTVAANKAASGTLPLHLGDGVDVNAAVSAADRLVRATLGMATLLVVATDPNASCLRKEKPNVPQALLEAQLRVAPGIKAVSMPAFVAAAASLAPGRGLIVKVCMWVGQITRAAAETNAANEHADDDDGAVAANAAYATNETLADAHRLVGACLSTPAARTAVHHRFEDELLLMDNVRASECAAILELFQRSTMPSNPEKRKAIAPAKVADNICDWLGVLQVACAAFATNLRWRTILDEKRRLALIRAGSKVGPAFGVPSGVTADAVGNLGEESALDRLSGGRGDAAAEALMRARGTAAGSNTDDVFGDADSVAGGVEASTPKAGGGDDDDDEDDDKKSVGASTHASTHGHTTHGGTANRSEGGYTHMSARTAATTARGKAVVEAITNLHFEKTLQNIADADGNAHLPTVLQELSFSWAARAITDFMAAFLPDDAKAAGNVEAAAVCGRLVDAVLKFVTGTVRVLAQRTVFDPIEDTRFNGSRGMQVLERTLLEGILTPALASVAAASSTTATPVAVPAGNVLGSLVVKLGKHAMAATTAGAAARVQLSVFEAASGALTELDAVAPAATRRHFATLVETFNVHVDRAALQPSVLRSTTGVLACFARRFAHANQLPSFIEALQKALLTPADPGTTSLLAACIANDTGSAQDDAADESVEHQRSALAKESLRRAITDGTAGALDPEGVVSFAADAIAAAVAQEGADDSDDDSDDDGDVAAQEKAPTPADGKVVPWQARGALIALCRSALQGVSPTSLSALPCLEKLLETDVQVATHTAANVLTRIGVADMAVSEAVDAYKESSTSANLKAVCAAELNAAEERHCASEWLQLLGDIRALGLACAGDLGVTSPDVFLETVEATVWNYRSEMTTVLAAFDTKDLGALVQWPERDEAMPTSATDDVAATLRDALQERERTAALLAVAVAGLAALRLRHATGVLTAVTNCADVEAGSMAPLPSDVDAKAAKGLAKQVHESLVTLLTDAQSRTSRASAGSGQQRHAAELVRSAVSRYTASIAMACFAHHPNGAAQVAQVLLTTAAPQSTGTSTAQVAPGLAALSSTEWRRLTAVLVGLGPALSRWLSSNSKRCQEALKTLLAAPSKKEWSRALDSSADPALLDALGIVQCTADVLAGVRALSRERGALAGGVAALTVVGDLQRAVAAMLLAKPAWLGAVPKPGSALHAALGLLREVRAVAADELCLRSHSANSTGTAVVAAIRAIVLGDSAPNDETIAASISGLISTASVEPLGAALTTTALWSALASDVAASSSSSSSSKRTREDNDTLGWFTTERRTHMLATLAAELASAAESCPAIKSCKQDQASERIMALLSQVLEQRALVPASIVAEATSSTSSSSKRKPRSEADAQAEASRPAKEPSQTYRQLLVSLTALANVAIKLAKSLLLAGANAVACGVTRRALVHVLPLLATSADAAATIRKAAADALAATASGSTTTLRALLEGYAMKGDAAAWACLWSLLAATGGHPPVKTNAAKSSAKQDAADSDDDEPQDSAAKGPSTLDAAKARATSAPTVLRAVGTLTSSSTSSFAEAALRSSVSSVSRLVGHVERLGAACDGADAVDVARILDELLRVPGIKTKTVKPALVRLLTASLRARHASVPAAALSVCRHNTRAMHKDPGFLELQLAVMSHCLSLVSTATGGKASGATVALVVAAKQLVMLATGFTESLTPHAPEVVSIVRLLVRATLTGLKSGALVASAATVLGSTLYHVSRPAVMSALGRRNATAVAGTIAAAILDEMSRHPDVVAKHSLALDRVATPFVVAAGDRHDVLFGLLRHSPQAQALLRKAVAVIDESRLDATVIDPGLAVPTRGGAGDTAVAFGGV